MSIYLDKSVWLENIKGWHIVDCAVRESTIVYLCLRKDIPDEKASEMWDHDISTEFFIMNLAKPGTSYGARELIGYNRPRNTGFGHKSQSSHMRTVAMTRLHEGREL